MRHGSTSERRKETKLLANTDRTEKDSPVPGMAQEYFFVREGIKQAS